MIVGFNPAWYHIRHSCTDFFLSIYLSFFLSIYLSAPLPYLSPFPSSPLPFVREIHAYQAVVLLRWVGQSLWRGECHKYVCQCLWHFIFLSICHLCSSSSYSFTITFYHFFFFFYISILAPPNKADVPCHAMPCQTSSNQPSPHSSFQPLSLFFILLTSILHCHTTLHPFTQPLPASAVTPSGCRYDGQIAVYGTDVQLKLGQLSMFLVGAGAIGWADSIVKYSTVQYRKI